MAVMMLNVFAFGQGSDWMWSTKEGGLLSEQIQEVAIDDLGNVIVAGNFASISITIGTTTFLNSDTGGYTNDVLIVKYDPNGNLLWAKSGFGSKFHEKAHGLAIDPDGNIIVSGYLGSPYIIFGTDTLFSAGIDDIFLVKYDPDGNVIWAKREGGNSEDRSYSATTDSDGNIFLSGYFRSDSLFIGSDTLINSDPIFNHSEVFIVKYDPDGNVLWVKGAYGDNFDYIQSVATDANGNIYATGQFLSSSLTFGTTTLTNYSGTGEKMDIFLVEYDRNGNLLQAKSFGGSIDDLGASVVIDASGNIILAGYFSSQNITFDTITLNKTGTRNPFVVKLDSLWNVLWAKNGVGNSADYCSDVYADDDENITITGHFFSDNITFGTTTLTNAGVCDIFLVKYDPIGNIQFAKSIGGEQGEISYSLTGDADGNIILSGDFSSLTLSFGTNTLINSDNGGNSGDIFIAKLNAFADIEETSVDAPIKIFPNPCTTQTVLTSNNGLHEATLILYNVLGQPLKKITNISGQSVILKRDDLPAGLYVIQLIQNDRVVATEKLQIVD